MKPESLWTVWKIRIQLWWMFGVDDWKNGTTSNHRLGIRWTKGVKYWRWVCVVEGHHYTLGPVRQWTLQEALNLAARKAEWVLHPDQEPVKEPEPNPTAPNHQKVYRLLENGKFRVECLFCGWIGNQLRCHPETDAPKRCELCAQAENSYDQHMVGQTIPITHKTSGDFHEFSQPGV